MARWRPTKILSGQEKGLTFEEDQELFFLKVRPAKKSECPVGSHRSPKEKIVPKYKGVLFAVPTMGSGGWGWGWGVFPSQFGVNWW